MDLTEVMSIHSPSGSSHASELQRVCDAALLKCPISFLEGDNISEFSDRIQRYCVLSTGLQPFPLSRLSGLLHASEFLDSLAPTFLPPDRRGFSSGRISDCVRRPHDVSAFADIFCGGDLPRAHSLLVSPTELASLPQSYAFPAPSSALEPTLAGDARVLSSPLSSPAFSARDAFPPGLSRRLHSPSSPTAPFAPPPASAAGSSPLAGSPASASRSNPSQPAPPPASAAGSTLLASIFPGSSSYATEISALLLILGTDFDPFAPPALDELASMLDQQPGALLVRVATMLRLGIPEPTKDTFSSWGSARRANLVVGPLARRLHAVLAAYSSHRDSPSPPASVAPAGAASLGQAAASGGGGGGAPAPPYPPPPCSPKGGLRGLLCQYFSLFGHRNQLKDP